MMDKFFVVLLVFFILTFSVSAVVAYQVRLENDELKKQLVKTNFSIINLANILEKDIIDTDNSFNEYDIVLNNIEQRFIKNEEKIGINTASISPKNFRWVKIKKVRDAVNKTIEEFKYNRFMNTKELTEYATSVVDYSEKYDVPISLILAMTRKESAFNPKAVSSAKAKGIMQIIPNTAEQIASEIGKRHFNMFKISDNVRFAAYYIMTLMDRYNRNFETVLQAYNCGPTCVNRVKSRQYKKFPEETEIYVRMILTSCVRESIDGLCEHKGFKKYYEDMGL
jgi:hypothetical protein